ncbi:MULTISPECIES: hypothetical protein [Corallococcus]|nr:MULTISPECIES: hypothetical protein [Corallococcus]
MGLGMGQLPVLHALEDVSAMAWSGAKEREQLVNLLQRVVENLER